MQYLCTLLCLRRFDKAADRRPVPYSVHHKGAYTPACSTSTDSTAF